MLRHVDVQDVHQWQVLRFSSSHETTEERKDLERCALISRLTLTLVQQAAQLVGLISGRPVDKQSYA